MKTFPVLAFIAIGMFSSFYAIEISLEGMREKGIQCLTGVVAFIPLSLVVNFIGIPILLFSIKKPRTFKTD